MKTLKCLLIIPLFFLCSCSKDSDSIKIAEQFFSVCDSKDFKAAYNLLSVDDRNAFSADSFYILFYNADDEIARLGNYEIRSTFIRENKGDTLYICQVWKLPDYSLIQKTKDKETKLGDFFKKMESNNSIPMVLDSSRIIRVVRTKGSSFVHLGLANFKKYQDMVESKKKYYSSQVSITPVKIEVSKHGYADYLGKGTVRIDNKTDYPISGFTCSLLVGGATYKEDCFDWIVAEVNSHSLKISSSYLSGENILFAKYVPAGDYYGTVPSSKIMIKVKDIYFADTLSQLIHQEALKISDFKYFRFLKPGINKHILNY